MTTVDAANQLIAAIARSMKFLESCRNTAADDAPPVHRISASPPHSFSVREDCSRGMQCLFVGEREERDLKEKGKKVQSWSGENFEIQRS